MAVAPTKLKQVAPKPNMKKNVKARVKRMKAVMAKIGEEQKQIGEEQKHIREGQRMIVEKFKAIETECDQLREETEKIMKLSARSKIKIDLMFKILIARKDGDFTQAATLAHLLGEILAKERANASLDEENPE